MTLKSTATHEFSSNHLNPLPEQVNDWGEHSLAAAQRSLTIALALSHSSMGCLLRKRTGQEAILAHTGWDTLSEQHTAELLSLIPAQEGFVQLNPKIEQSLRRLDVIKAHPDYQSLILLPIRDVDGEAIGCVYLLAHTPPQLNPETRHALSELIAGFVDQCELQMAHDHILRAAHELNRQNMQKDHLFGLIAHDIKTPFTSILGIVDLFFEEYDFMSAGEIKEMIRDLHQSAHDIYHFVDSLLHWSALERGMVKTLPRRINLKELINPLIAAASIQGRRANINTQVDMDTNYLAYADPKMIRGILEYLIKNALHNTPDGGQIGIAISDRPTMVDICISDNGKAFSADEMAIIFDAHRLTRPNANQFHSRGSGLELLLCHRLAELNLGCLIAQSHTGTGTIFRLSLPKPPLREGV